MKTTPRFTHFMISSCLAALFLGLVGIEPALVSQPPALPPVPVEVQFSPAPSGKGYVGMIKNELASTLLINVTVENPGLHKYLGYPVVAIGPNGTLEMGVTIGFPFALGDTVVIRSSGWSPLQFVVSP
jgi:hypothetical protein